MEISVLLLRDVCEPWCCVHSGPGLCVLPQPLHPGPLRALPLILPSSTVSRTPAQAGQHQTLGPTWHFQMNIWGYYQRVCSEHVLLCLCHLQLLGTWRVFTISD